MLLRSSVTKVITTAGRPVWRLSPPPQLRPLSTTLHKPAAKPSFSTPAYGLASSTGTHWAAETTAAERQVTLDDFKRLAEDKTATVNDAKLCLKQSRAEIERLPISQRKEACAEKQVGGRVMLWLISQDLEGNPYLDRDLTDALCWFALPEDLERYLFCWIARELGQPTRAFDKEKPCLSPHWLAQRLIGSLISAHASWSPSDGDPALQCFQKAVMDFGDHRLGQGHRGLFMSAYVALARFLRHDYSPPSSEQLYDFAVEQLWRREKDGYEERARWPLYDPARPTADLLLSWLQDPESPLHAIFSAKAAKANALAQDILRGSVIFRLQGYDEKAQWLEQIVESQCKAVWFHRAKIYRSHEDDPKVCL